MRYIKYRVIIESLIFVLISVFPSLASQETIQKESITAENNGLTTIESNSFEFDIKRNIVTFIGDVDIRKGDLEIKCNKMLVYYKSSQKNKGDEIIQSGIEKIVASGEVNIILPDGGLATSDEAVYFNDDAKLILTGSPMLKQGTSMMAGSKITYLLNEKRGIVESSEGSKAKAVLSQEKIKR